MVVPFELNNVDVYVVTEPTFDLNTINYVDNSDQIQEYILDLGCAFCTISTRH